jgi:hypothetical protein
MRFRSSGPLVLLVVLMICGCGSGRQLQSVKLSPTSADARNFPNGQVPFAATGTFSGSPSPTSLTSQNIEWCIGSAMGACSASGPSVFPAVDQNGVAQCGPTFVGTVTVLAGTGARGVTDAPVFATFGAAQLTCP